MQRQGAQPARAAMRNRDVQRVLCAITASTVADWALWVGVLVYAHDHGGAAVAGFASVGLLVPSIVISPWSGRAADGRRPHRVLVIGFVVVCLSAAAAAACSAAGSGALPVVIAAASTVTAIGVIRPTSTVVLPGLVTSTAELTGANLLAGLIEGAGVLVGPLIAGLLLEADGPRTVFAACALLGVLGTLATLPLLRIDRSPPDPTPASEVPTLRSAVRDLATRRGAIGLLVVLMAQYVLIGGLDLLFVILAAGVIDAGAGGAGFLGTAFGAGALIGGIASATLVGRRRLAPALVGSLIAMGASTAVLGWSTTLVSAVVLLPVCGASRSVLDITGRMLLQRAAPQEALASVFTVLEALGACGIITGSLLVQIAVAASGARGALIALAACFAVVAVTTVRGLRHIDASADAPVVAIRLLRRIPVFGALPGPALEGVGRAAVTLDADAGDVLVREGEAGDRYYAIVAGEVDVTQRGRHLRVMGRSEGFGEIALLADVPRTATVTARGACRLLAIPRGPFLTAVTGHDASARTAWAIARELAPGLGTVGDGVS